MEEGGHHEMLLSGSQVVIVLVRWFGRKEVLLVMECNMRVQDWKVKGQGWGNDKEGEGYLREERKGNDSANKHRWWTVCVGGALDVCCGRVHTSKPWTGTNPHLCYAPVPHCVCTCTMYLYYIPVSHCACT